MLKTLVGVRLAALRSWFTGAARSKKTQSKAKLFAFTLLMLYALASLGFAFWHYLSVMSASFFEAGLAWLYWAVVALSDFSLMFIGTVFFAKAQLYEAKDNELLLSMPVKPSAILVSRLVMLLVISAVFSLPVLIPAAYVGWSAAAPGVYGVAAFLLVFLLLPFFALSAAALFGWLLSLLSARVKNKSLFGTIACVAAMLAYSYFIARLNSSMMEGVDYAQGISGALGGIVLLYWIGSAVAGSAGYLALVCLIFTGTSAAAYCILSVTFIRTATAQRGFARAKYVERSAKTASPDTALLRRELACLCSSSAYMVNCGLGLLMTAVAAAALVIKRAEVHELLASAPELAVYAPSALTLALCLLAAMNFFSAPAVSLEGKSIWIAQSLPVDTKRILRSKLKMHIYICAPVTLLASLICSAVLGLGAVQTVLVVVQPLVFTVFMALLGLTENLRHPNLDWINETQAVKTGFGLLFTMLISWAVIALLVLLLIFTGSAGGGILTGAVSTAVMVFVCLLMYRWLMNKGVKLYRAL